MNNILELIKGLNNNQKYKLLEQLKKIINSEFEVNEINEEICCPKCNKINFSKMGLYNETQRYICKECNTTFTSKIRTIFSTTKLEKEKWLKYPECFVDVLSLRRCAEKVNVCLKTSFFMRHRIIECISKNIEDFRVGTKNKVQLDETYLRENFKGNHTKGNYFTMPRKARKDGHASLKIGSSNEQICISCGIND